MNPNYRKHTLIIITLILSSFLMIGFCYGGDTNTVSDDEPLIIDDYEGITFAEEDGHLNTSFSDGSKGYCIEYLEQEATTGDKFYKVNTTYAKNNETKEDVSRYLKTYFIDHYDETQKDAIVTQHTIWHFTNNFNGWRINYTLVDNIKDNVKDYGDKGVKRWNETHEMVYEFNVLLPYFEHHQNYFTYKIGFRPYVESEDNLSSNDSVSNQTKPQFYHNESLNGTSQLNHTCEDEVTYGNLTVNNENMAKDSSHIHKYGFEKKLIIQMKDTGNKTLLLYVSLIVLSILLIVKTIYAKQ